jgi:hypothetical protein
MFKKNLKVIFGKSSFLVAHVATVLLVMFSIFAINLLTNYSYKHETSFTYPPRPVGNLQRCTFTNCKTVGTAILGPTTPALYDQSLAYIKKTSDF